MFEGGHRMHFSLMLVGGKGRSGVFLLYFEVPWETGLMEEWFEKQLKCFSREARYLNMQPEPLCVCFFHKT
jgi:hypothetical protein